MIKKNILLIILTLLIVIIFSAIVISQKTSLRKVNSVKDIDDSSMLDTFTYLQGFKSISFDISSTEPLDKEVQERDSSVGKTIKNKYDFSSLEVESTYQEVDTSFFNTDTRPVKQTYIIKNLLDKNQEVTLTVKHEIDSSTIIWNGTEYEITQNPRYFEAFYEEYEIFPEISESYLTGNALYFGNNYYDFKDIVDLNYKVSVYSEGNKNYIDLEINADVDRLEEFVIDPEIGWTTRIISRTIQTFGRSVFAIDIDNDDDIDVLSATRNDDNVSWYENDGNTPPGWTSRLISTSENGPSSIFAIDVDSDGDIDALSAAVYDDKIAWYENDGNTPPGWTARTINTSADWAESVFAIDLDNDDDIDVLSASVSDDKIAWYENDGSTPPSWTGRVISTSENGPVSVFAIDIDNDDDIDVLSASYADDKIAWYENDGGSPPGWTTRIINSSANVATSVYAIDLDNDDDIDVLSSSEYDDKIAWYENDGNTPPGWTARIITSSADGARSVFAIDLDNDDDIDVLSASVSDDKIAWYENDGSTPPDWTTQIIDTTINAQEVVFAIDIDGDFDIDALSINLGSPVFVTWYESDLISEPKLKILAVPLNWSGNQSSFEGNATEQIDFFIDDTGLASCPNRVVIDTLSVDDENFEDFKCYNKTTFDWSELRFIGCNVESITPFVENLGIDPIDYDHIIGFVENSVCLPTTGCSDGERVAWVTTGLSDKSVGAHEIGHFYGLEDEYCSNPAGSSNCNCNDAGVFELGCFIWQGFSMDVNSLDVDLGCNATEGGSCCGSEAGLPECSTVNYDICCRGNNNSLGGIATMSYTGASEPRGFDDHSKSHLNTFSQLNCEGSATPEDIIDINLIIHENDTIDENWIFLTNGEKTVYNKSGNYSLIIYDNQSSILFNRSLEILFGYFGPRELNVNYSSIDYTTDSLNFQVPYNSTMFQLNLSHGNNVIYSKILNFCNNNSICEVTENYETCPSDCPLNESDNICIAECDGICDPDCAEGVDSDCSPLYIPNLDVVYSNSTERIFNFDINNTGCFTLGNVSWNLDTGETNISAIYNTTLQGLEDLFIYTYYNYTNPGNYTVIGTGYGDGFSDSRSLNITV